VEAFSVSLQCLQPIAGGHGKVVKPCGGIQVLQLALGRTPEFGREPPRPARHPILE
jgi:hypothetical protein